MEHEIEQGQYSEKFNGEDWIQLDDIVIEQSIPSNEFTLATYNILFGWKIQAITKNSKRFNFIVNSLIPKQAPDILILNEVTQEFLNHLKNSEFIKQHYNSSSLTLSRSYSFHGLIILSKFQFRYYVVKISNRKYQLGLFQLNNQPFFVISCHLEAYEGRTQKRAEELQNIDCFIRRITENPTEIENRQSKYFSIVSKALKRNNIFLLGDMNLHFPIETRIIYKYNFLDLWVEYHQETENKGYTWDAKLNNLITCMLPFDNRRMRLDRITVRKENEIIASIKQMTIEAKEKIGFLLSGSDHFMLLARIQISDVINKKYDQKISDERVSEKFSSRQHGFRSIKQVVILRLIALALIWCLILFLIRLFI